MNAASAPDSNANDITAQVSLARAKTNENLSSKKQKDADVRQHRLDGRRNRLLYKA
jgi:hypothetical protein